MNQQAPQHEPSPHHERWVVRIPWPCDLRSLAESRHRSIEVLVPTGEESADASLWLRCDGDQIPDCLYALPQAAFFRSTGEAQLVALGDRLPSGVLPNGNWAPLEQWLKVTPPQSMVGGAGRMSDGNPVAGTPRQSTHRGVTPSFHRVDLQMTRATSCATSSEASYLMTEFTSFETYVLRSLEFRVSGLRYVCTIDGKVLCCGEPLPALPGESWYETDGVLAPAGWTWSPAVPATVVYAALQFHCACKFAATPTKATKFLLHADGPVEMIDAHSWCSATYASVRATKEALS